MTGWRRLRPVAPGDTASDFSKGAPGVYRQDFEDMGYCQTIRSSVRALRNSIRTLGNHAQLGNGVANDGDKDSHARTTISPEVAPSWGASSGMVVMRDEGRDLAFEVAGGG
jgi:hypothetical protein